MVIRVPSRLFAALVVAFLIASRALCWTPHPPNFDFANFALAVHRFAPSEHQPHPPGYPLVVLVAKGFAALGLSAVRALEATALLGSILAIFGAYRLGKRLGGEAGGMLACFLLAIEPVFWFSGVTSPTRVYLAAGVCWLLDRSMDLAAGRGSRLWGSAAMLAVFAGFRPELLVFFAMPLVIAARRAGIAWKKIAMAAGLCFALCLPWILWVTSSFGSPFRMLYVYYYYFLHHISTTSVLLGAPAGAWQKMLWISLLWNSLPAAVAVLAFLVSRKRARIELDFWLLAGAYFIPALIVQLAIHEGADSPDHSLGTIAVLCVLAGAVLGASRAYWVAAPAAVAMLSISLSSPGKLMPEFDLLSLRAFAKEQHSIAAGIDGLRSSLRPADAILVLNESPLDWRTLEHEFPQNTLLFFETTVQNGTTGSPAGWRVLNRRAVPLSEEGIFLAGVDRLQILSQPSRPQRQLVWERLCNSFPCETHGSRLEVNLSAQSVVGTQSPSHPIVDSVSLPPYTLRFVGR